VERSTITALKFGAPYSNSLGMLRRSAWERRPFRTWAGRDLMEDYLWALEEAFAGRALLRLPIRFHYLRRGHSREVDHTRMVFALAYRLGVPVRWRGARSALTRWLQLAAIPGGGGERAILGERLLGWATWRQLPGWRSETLELGPRS
jgi:hypothetical protein